MVGTDSHTHAGGLGNGRHRSRRSRRGGCDDGMEWELQCRVSSGFVSRVL